MVLLGQSMCPDPHGRPQPQHDQIVHKKTSWAGPHMGPTIHSLKHQLWKLQSVLYVTAAVVAVVRPRVWPLSMCMAVTMPACRG